MTPMAIKMRDDNDIHKGAIEGDRPGDEQQGNPLGTGFDDEGLQVDPIDSSLVIIGAIEDGSDG